MITVSKSTLLPVLDRCSKVTAQKATQVQLGHIKLEFDNDVLEYAATNLVTSIRGSVAATGKPAKFTVNVRDLATAAKSVIGDDVKLSLNDKNKLKVSGEGKRSFTCDTLPADEFPSVPLAEGAFIDLPGESLRQMLTRVSFAMAPESDDRDGLKSIRLRLLDGILSAAAANGRTLGFASDAVDNKKTFTAIVSRGGVNSLLATESGVVGINISDRFIFFLNGSETLIVKTLADSNSFPPIETAIEQCQSMKPKTGFVNARELVDSLSVIKRSDSKAMIDLTFSKNELKIENGREGEAGYATDSIPNAGEDSGEVRLDIDYLMSALKGSENVTLGFGQGIDPFTITDGMYTAIIMPMQKQ